MATHKCIICSTSFESKRYTQKYCTSKCIKTAWRRNNPESNLKSQQKYLDTHKEARYLSSKAYTIRNRAYYNQYSTLRSRKVQNAKPRWVNEEELLNIYKQAGMLGLEVDHIIPITHKLVCGLHVPWNLQLLTRSENAKKSNKFKTDDEDVICRFTKEKV